MEVSLGGISQLAVILTVLGGTVLFTYQKIMSIETCVAIWGGIMSGMGIGFINGKKA